jgi:hypothetical protein
LLTHIKTIETKAASNPIILYLLKVMIICVAKVLKVTKGIQPFAKYSLYDSHTWTRQRSYDRTLEFLAEGSHHHDLGEQLFML